MSKDQLKIVYVPLKDLKFAEYNPRKISSKDIDEIKNSLLNFGWVENIVVNSHPDRKNVIVGGHQRVKVAKNMGIKEAPVFYVNLPLEKEKELNIRLNKSGGEFDKDMLLEFFNTDELLEWGFEKIELGLQNDLLPDLGADGEDGSGEGSEEEKPKKNNISKEDYENFILVLTSEQKDKLVQTINHIKKDKNIVTAGEAVMYLVDNYIVL